MAASIGSPFLWIGFGVFVLAMLALDLGVFHRRAHAIGFREALIWTLVWISLAVVFNAGIYYYSGSQKGLEFLTGYVIEYALSVDNLFIFLLIFKYFSVPAQFQHRILFWGILGALVMRLLFILLGAALLARFEWVVFLFGAVVVLGGLKMMKEEEMEVHPERNLVLRIFQRFVPTTHQDTGSSLIVRRDGRIYATPLLLVLLVVEATDVAFAADSIPAIFAVTRDPFIAFTSNIFAILGLRSLYLLVAGAFYRFYYLKWGLGLVLLFVGTKMLISEWVAIPIGASLAVVGALLGGSLLISFLWPRSSPPSSSSGESSSAPPGSEKKAPQ